VDTAAAPRKRFDPVAYLKLFRFPLVFTAIADSSTAYLLTSDWNPDPQVLAFVAICSAGLYLFGMALNDIADLNRDREAAPTKVLPSGRISRSRALYAAFAALAISLSAIVGLGVTGFPVGQRLVFWVVAVVAIVCYDCHLLKAPPTMAVVRASNFLLGLGAGRAVGYATGHLEPWRYFILAVPVFVYVTALTYVSTLEDAAVDRRKLAAGVIGMIVAGFMASYAHAFFLAVWMAEEFREIFAGVFRAEWSATLLAVVLALWLARRAWKAADKKGVMLLVRDGVACIIVLNSILLTSMRHFVAAAIIAALLLPAAASIALLKRLA